MVVVTLVLVVADVAVSAPTAITSAFLAVVVAAVDIVIGVVFDVVIDGLSPKRNQCAKSSNQDHS